MTEKRVSLGPRVREPIKKQLDEVMRQHGDERGLQQWCFEAALLMFFDSGPQMQAEWLERVRTAGMRGGTNEIVREIKAKYAKGTHGFPAEDDDA